jgi:transcriptional regulator with XRE-family HTH domain
MAKVKPENAHIASLLRSKMSERQIGMSDLNELLGIPRNRTTAYPWLKATGVPTEQYRKKLSQVFGTTEEAWMPKEATTLPRNPKTAIVKYSPSKTKPMQVKSDPLFFKILNNNTAQIQFNATLPIEQAKSLMRLLLDYNVT